MQFTSEHGIVFQGQSILMAYPEYRSELQLHSKVRHYDELWRLKQIFH